MDIDNNSFKKELNDKFSTLMIEDSESEQGLEDTFNNTDLKKINESNDSFEVSDDDHDFERDIRPLLQQFEKKFVIEQSYNDYNLINDFLEKNPHFPTKFKNAPCMPKVRPILPIPKLGSFIKDAMKIMDSTNECRGRGSIPRISFNEPQSSIKNNSLAKVDPQDEHLSKLITQNDQFELNENKGKKELARIPNMDQSIEQFYKTLGDEENDLIIKNAILKRLVTDRDSTEKNESSLDVKINEELKNMVQNFTSLKLASFECSNINKSKNIEKKNKSQTDPKNSSKSVCNAIKNIVQEQTQSLVSCGSLLSNSVSHDTNISSNYLGSSSSKIKRNEILNSKPTE